MPRVLSDPAEIRAAADVARASGQRLGLVATMGALHEGHRALIRRAAAECDVVFVSIYVNPTQFAPGEDLDAYPHTFDADLAACREEGADTVLHLRDADMYPPGFTTWVRVDGLADHLEGASRPDHFRGVTTIVTKLFHLAKPHRSYFGQKDAQQAIILRRMTADLDFGVDVVICPTVREPDDLALSSRNRYLSEEQRRQATALIRGLRAAEIRYQAGERRTGALLEATRAMIDAEPAMTIDYVEVVDTATVTPCWPDAPVPDRALIAGAVWLGQVRLIDNLLLPPGSEL